MNRLQAKTLLSVNFEEFSVERLQKHRVKLLDAWRESKAEYGMKQAVINGFYVPIESDSATGFVPKDLWLTHQIVFNLDRIEKMLQQVYSKKCKGMKKHECNMAK